MDGLREYMTKQGLTQAALAKLVGVSQPAVCEWLSGRSKPSTDTLLVLSEKTGLSIDDLLKGSRPC